MAEHLPLKALRTFEATARHLSFGKAARELHVTTGAVSQQIKALEEFLGVKLFKRLPHGLVLTEAGRAGLPHFSAGFKNLAKGLREIREYGEITPFSVWTTPSFASKWLVPRLKKFRQNYPNIDLRINASETMIESVDNNTKIDKEFFDAKGIDMAIMFGRSAYSDLESKTLMHVSVVPLCSPQLLEEGPHPLRSPSDLVHHTLLHDVTPYKGRPDWSVWLRKVGVEGVDPRHGLTFNHVSLVLQAAIDGQGVALGLMPLAQEDVDSGRLVVPFEPVFPLDYRYSIVSSSDTRSNPNFEIFCHWLTGQVQTTWQPADAGPAGTGFQSADE